MVLGVGTMMPAFAADGDLTVDEKVTVTGLEAGDTVTAYQFITWVDGEGWKLAEGITDITLDDIIDGLEVDELATLANNIDKMTSVASNTTDGTTWEMQCGSVDTAGSYLILVNSGTAEQIYNPAVVSADFDGTNNEALDLTADDATIKKQDVTILKEADNAPDDYDVQVGDIVPFTVTVTVPQYNANWTEPYFAVSDTLSTGLTISASPTIEGLTAGTDYTLTYGDEGDSGFTITFTESYLKDNAQAVLEITYSALVGEGVKDTAQVHEETNKVTLEFSNNPSNSDDHKTVDDETHHYTFGIDATRKGQGSEKTNELIKVGVDANGNPVTVYKEGETLPTGVSPLQGAEFTLTGKGPNDSETTPAEDIVLTAISDADGRVFFNNLEVGTYTLKETKAPAGYIKDQTEHTVVIAAEYNTDTTLKSYTITIDGEATSTYTATTNAQNVTTYEAPAGGNDTFPINNKQGTELPSTGGIGTTIFYIVGGGMVAGAVVFLLTKRRVAGNE
jgi:fimbrial isopeptide formation D2 family protein/LPXTG-motif cell wall-anchored protein